MARGRCRSFFLPQDAARRCDDGGGVQLDFFLHFLFTIVVYQYLQILVGNGGAYAPVVTFLIVPGRYMLVVIIITFVPRLVSADLIRVRDPGKNAL